MAPQSGFGERVKSGQSAEKDTFARSIRPIDRVDGSPFKESVNPHQSSLLGGKLFGHSERAEKESP